MRRDLFRSLALTESRYFEISEGSYLWAEIWSSLILKKRNFNNQSCRIIRTRKILFFKILLWIRRGLSSGWMNPSIPDVTFHLHFLFPRGWGRGDVAEESVLSGRLRPRRALWWLSCPPFPFLLDHGGLPYCCEWQQPHPSPHLCWPPAPHTHVPPPQPALAHGADACLHHHPQDGDQLPLWPEVHLLCGLCDPALPLSDSGRCGVSSPSFHVLWPLRCHLSSTALLCSHEQKGDANDGCHVLVGSVPEFPNLHGNLDALPFLWASTNPPLLLWVSSCCEVGMWRHLCVRGHSVHQHPPPPPPPHRPDFYILCLHPPQCHSDAWE